MWCALNETFFGRQRFEEANAMEQKRKSEYFFSIIKSIVNNIQMRSIHVQNKALENENVKIKKNTKKTTNFHFI